MSDDELITYCGLYCGLCAERNILPTKARELLEVVRDEGYDSFYEYVPGMKEHYPSFVKLLQDFSDMDCKCREGRGGPPDCGIRACAKERNVFVCMDCSDFPCEKWSAIARSYPFLTVEASRYREVGKDKWLAEQKSKASKGLSYRMLRLTDVGGPTPDHQDG